MKYNIAIVEDDLELRQTLSNFFAKSDRLDCVMAVDSIEKFLKYHRDFFEIKLILLDVMLHGQSSIYSIPHLLQREPDAEIIMFTMIDDSNFIFQAMTYGATGYLIKNLDLPELEQSLYEVLQGGGALLSPSVAKKIIQTLFPPLLSTDKDELNNKEYSVLKWLKAGYTYDEIAMKMGLSVNGIRYYIKSIYKKLRVNSRGELLRKSDLPEVQEEDM